MSIPLSIFKYFQILIDNSMMTNSSLTYLWSIQVIVVFSSVYWRTEDKCQQDKNFRLPRSYGESSERLLREQHEDLSQNEEDWVF